MRFVVPALVLITLLPRGATAQSVADTLASLSARVGQLESRPTAAPASAPATLPAGRTAGWPSFLETSTGDTQSSLSVLTPGKRWALNMRSNAAGGAISVYSSLHSHAGLVVESRDKGQNGRVVADWFNKLGKRVMTVGTEDGNTTGNLWIYNSEADRLLTYVGANTDGGEVEVYSQHSGSSVKLWSSNAQQSGRVTVDWFNNTRNRVVTVGLGTNNITGGIWIYDNSGNKELAFFGTTLDGAAGYVSVNGARVHDYAETFEIANRDGIAPGSVVSASADGRGIVLSSKPYDPATVGVISGAGDFQPGMRIGSREDGSTDLPVAVAGQVYVKVNLESGPIAVGDLLVSSSVPGVAMKGADKQRLIGTVIGKALQPYGSNAPGLVQMLVLNR